MQQGLAGDELIFGYASMISSIVVRVRVERKHGFMTLETQFSIEEKQILRIIRFVNVRAHAAFKQSSHCERRGINQI